MAPKAKKKPVSKVVTSKPLSHRPSSNALAKREPSTDDLVRIEAEKKLGPAAQLALKAQAATVTSLSTLNAATNLLEQLKLNRVALEEQRSFFTKPLREHVKRIETLFRPTIQQLEAADDGLRGKVTTYLVAEREKAEAAARIEQAKADKAAAKGNEEKAAEHALAAVTTIAQASQKTFATDAGGSMGVRMVDDYEVEDLGAVPREYMMLDAKAVQSAVRSGVASIPGIRIFKKPQLAVTAGSSVA